MIYGMQIVSLLVLVGVGIYASLSDRKTGRISNKVLALLLSMHCSPMLSNMEFWKKIYGLPF